MEIEKEMVREVARGDKPDLRKSTDRKAQISPLNWTNAFLICALRSVDFLRSGLSPRATSRTISFSISNSFWYYLSGPQKAKMNLKWRLWYQNCDDQKIVIHRARLRPAFRCLIKRAQALPQGMQGIAFACKQALLVLWQSSWKLLRFADDGKFAAWKEKEC